jgi:alpha-L-fucosidase 2
VQGGYTVFAINHRAAPRFRYPANVEDGQRAVRFVRGNADRFGIDADRIGVFGASSGGYLSNMLGLLDTEPHTTSATGVESESAAVQAVVSMYAPSDLVTFTENREGDQERIPSFMGMPLNIARDLYREASPINYVSADDPPFLLIHCDMDETVPFNQSVLLYERLQALGVPAEFVRMPGGTHGPGIRADASAPDYFRATVDWFDRHLRQ